MRVSCYLKDLNTLFTPLFDSSVEDKFNEMIVLFFLIACIKIDTPSSHNEF
jgi:hypothetical protein